MDKPTPIEIKQGATFRLPCEYTDGVSAVIVHIRGKNE